MKKKNKSISNKEIELRLNHDENSWTKLLGSMGDFARYWRQLEAQLKKDRRLLIQIKKQLKSLDQRISILEGSKPTDVDSKSK